MVDEFRVIIGQGLSILFVPTRTRVRHDWRHSDFYSAGHVPCCLFVVQGAYNKHGEMHDTCLGRYICYPFVSEVLLQPLPRLSLYSRPSVACEMLCNQIALLSHVQKLARQWPREKK